MISFSPTDDQKMMEDAVAQLARSTLRPRMREHEKARSLAEDVRKVAHEMGLGLVAIPAELGGAGLGLTTAVLLEEALAVGDSAAPFGLAGPGALGFVVSELGSAEQAARLLAPFAADDGFARFGAVAWSERNAVRERRGLATTAVKTEGGAYRIDGVKSYVLNADRANALVVFAQLDAAAEWGGIGAFVVERGAKGLSVGERETTLGLDVASVCDVTFDGVVVAAENRLGAALGSEAFAAGVIRFFAKYALLVAARGVGLACAAFETTREYCDSRIAFGKPVGHFQAIAFTLADRAMDVEAARALVHRAAHAWDSGAPERDALRLTGQAVSFVHEAAMRCGDDAVQLHGGAGFIRDYPVEKWMRDAKQLQLCALTAEQADQLVAAIELGQPLDPAWLLPSAESQNVFT